MEKVVGETRNEVGDLQKRVLALEKGRKEGTSTRASTEEANPTEAWTPTGFWLKGFASYERKSRDGATREELQSFFDSVKKELPPLLQNACTGLKLDGPKNCRAFVIVNNPTLINEIMGHCREMLRESRFHFRASVQIFAAPERSPVDQKRYSAAGRLMDWAATTSGRKARCTWAPDFHVQIRTSEMTDAQSDELWMTIAIIQSDGSAQWLEQPLSSVLRLSIGDAQQQCASFRRF